ncbi:ParA family protein [Wenxinia marina]|nr:AAA family ATPase [Wenxinia marina]
MARSLQAKGREAGIPGSDPDPESRRDTDGEGPRRFAIWEIAEWMLPVSAEYLRRTLREVPTLPRGDAEGRGALRFTAGELSSIRAHFAATGSAERYLPPPRERAVVVAMAAPLGAAGRSRAAAELAVAAALDGWRVIAIDGSGRGDLARRIEAGPAQEGGRERGRNGGMRDLFAAAAGRALRARNAALAERGERPAPMPADLAAAAESGRDLARPSRWPGLSVIAGGAELAAADLALAEWDRAVPGWSAVRALEEALAPLRQEADLILIDPPRGLGLLATSVLAGADLLLAPVGRDPGEAGLGLAVLDAALERIEAGERDLAAALGRPLPGPRRPEVRLLPLEETPPGLTGALPPLPAPPPAPLDRGGTRTWFDVDPRETGRAAQIGPRSALARLWRAVARDLAATGGGVVGAAGPAEG